MADRRRNEPMADAWRKRIKVGAILTRMNKHTLDIDGDLMTINQIRAADILLRKCLPDLKSIELTGEGGGPINCTVEITFVR